MPRQYKNPGGWSRERDNRFFGEDRFPHVANRLLDLRTNLPECAMKAYQALQLALQPHSRPHGSRPHFEKDFHESLSMLFPDAWDISARQIGAWNQWEVQVDDGPSMYCSVRLEVLSDNPQFLKEIKNKARIVKDVLLEDNGHWKRMLQPQNGAFSWERLSQFENECAHRLRQASTSDGAAVQPKRNSNAWVEQKILCEICGKPKEDDQLSGIHMCIVCATFQCPDCRYSWTSYHGRLRPDHETLMGQQCSRCNGQGVSKDWRVVAREDPDAGDSRKRAQHGMHQSELCDACREFGNCMGVFYDPFVLTTALSLASGQYVQWKAFSAEMPELLIADMGPQHTDLQVCLQPHVYVAQPQDEVYATEQTTYQRASKPLGSSKHKNYSKARQDWQGMDNDSFARMQGQGNAPSHRRTHGFLDEGYGEEDRQFSRTERASGGVTDAKLFQKFLANVDSPPRAQMGTNNSLPYNGRKPANKFARSEQPASPGLGRGLLLGPPPRDSLAEANKGALLASDEAGGSPETFWLKMMTPEPMPQPPAAEKVPKVNKFNKISNVEQICVAPTVPRPSTPLLDALPPLRSVQLLQIVVRQIKASGGTEADKYYLAEEYLSRCNGDYDKVYAYVKALNEGSTSAQ